jgi:hypothetical protein
MRKRQSANMSPGVDSRIIVSIRIQNPACADSCWSRTVIVVSGRPSPPSAHGKGHGSVNVTQRESELTVSGVGMIVTDNGNCVWAMSRDTPSRV